MVLDVCDASYPAVGILAPAHALEHSLVEPQLQTGLVKHLSLVAVSGDQTVDLDRLGLANTVTPRLGLVEDGFTESETLLYSGFYLHQLLCSVYRSIQQYMWVKS